LKPGGAEPVPIGPDSADRHGEFPVLPPPTKLSVATGRDILCLALLACVYLAVGMIVPPTDELPHCDDWDYVETARHFVRTGRIVYSDWPTTTLLTHILWGSTFAW